MQVTNKFSPKVIAGLLMLLFSILFIPYIYLSFFVHPVADDFTYGPQSPFWTTQRELFQHWNGRYSANFMIMANPILSGSIKWYRLSALIILLFLPLSIWFVLHSSVGKALSGLKKSIVASVIALIILSLLPSLPEGIYWYPGAVTYILGGIFAMFYFGLLIRFFNRKFILNRIFHFCLCVIFLCLAVGFNEVQMFILIFAHLVLWLSVDREARFRSPHFLLLLFCLLFSSIMFFAPGNYFRGEYFPNNHKLLNSAFMTSLQMFRFFFNWVSYAPLWIASILFAPISFKLNKRIPLFLKLGEIKPWRVFLLLWIVLFLCIFPPYWSTGILGQHRTLNTACFYFIPAWFLLLHTIYSRNNLSGKINTALIGSLRIGLLLLLAVSLLFSGNEGVALMELSTGKISAFDKEMNNRYTLMVSAREKGITEISLAPLQNKPASLFVLDIQPGCTHWINEQQAYFFGLKKIYGDSVNRLIK